MITQLAGADHSAEQVLITRLAGADLRLKGTDYAAEQALIT